MYIMYVEGLPWQQVFDGFPDVMDLVVDFNRPSEEVVELQVEDEARWLGMWQLGMLGV